MSDIIVNKVIKGEETYLDLTNDTVSEGTLLKNRTAHNSEGIQIQGTMEDGGGSVTGVKGDAESVYRDGDVNITAANIGTYTTSQIDALLNNKVDAHGTDSLMTNAEHVKLAGIEAGAEENVIESISLNGEEITPVNKAVALSIIDKDVNDLTNYYKKSETDASLGAKQNIILSSTLSIGGQTVTEVEEALGSLAGISKPMTGATSSAAGEGGFVPSPSAGDENKALFGDGTWKPVSGGGGGHTILDEDGTTYPQRSKLQFNGAIVSDDSENDTTVVDVEFLQNQLTDQTNVLGAKNLFINIAATETKNGITLTANSDGTLTLNGTSTAEAVFNIMGTSDNPLTSPWQDSLKGYDLRLTGCPSDGADDKYFIGLVKNDGTESRYRDYGEGVTFNYTTGTYRAYVVVRNGVTINNKVFKPMLRLASDPDDTYVPYAMTNRELTEVITETLTISDSTVTGSFTVSKVGKVVTITAWSVQGTTVKQGAKISASIPLPANYVATPLICANSQGAIGGFLYIDNTNKLNLHVYIANTKMYGALTYVCK